MKEKVYKKDEDIPNRDQYEQLVGFQTYLGENKIGI